MSLSRKIARRREFLENVIETHVSLDSPQAKTITLSLAGNTFSSARRRMLQANGKPAGKVQKPVRKLPAGIDRTEHRNLFKAGRQAARSASATPLRADEVVALLWNTYPRAVRKGELSLKDYRAGVRV